MQPVYLTKARLRTRTGCLECRSRRKKCDESPPQCGGCVRNGLGCTWPSPTSQIIDRRRREQKSHYSKHCAIDDSLLHRPFRPNDHSDMYTHFVTTVLPCMVRPNCTAEYNDPSHMLQLALEFPPLMSVMVGIAAVHLGKDHLAIESYLFSLHGLRTSIAYCSDAVNEDAILASTIFLCVFENLRPNATPNIGLHAIAAGVILSRRGSPELKQVAIFERICLESFLYHSTLMMLFEPSLDALQRVSPTVDLARYFCELPPPASQPILDASYPFFLLIADITRLARSTRPLNDIKAQTFTHLLSDLLRYEQGLSDGSSGIGLYLLTMRILLLKVDPTVTSVGATQQINHLSANGFTVLDSLNVNEYLLGFTLWPVAVLGSIAVTVSEKCIVERKISLLARRQRGPTMRLRDRFRAIWATPQVDKSTILVQRLHMLLKGI